MRPANKLVVIAVIGAMSLSACKAASQDAIAAEKFAQSTLQDPKIPIGPGSELQVESFEWGFNVVGNPVDGAVTVNLSNIGGATHNFRIDNAAGELKKVEAEAGGEAHGDLLLFGGGEYTYYCDVPGHRAQGMEGTFKVLLPGETAEAAPGADVGPTPEATDEPSAEPEPTATAAPTVEDLDDSDDVAGALDGKGFARLYQVAFASGSADLTDSAAPIIEQMAAYMRADATANVRIEGNTDSSGSDEANLSLSQERAEAVVAALVEAGIDGSRLSAVGNGESNPIIADEQSADDELVNRRVEVYLA